MLESTPNGQRTARELEQRYDELRVRLQALYATTAPDLKEIHAVMNELDGTHMAYKAAHGLVGNNPSESAIPAR